MEMISEVRCFGGAQQRFQHASESLGCDMIFAVYLPPQAAAGPRLPSSSPQSTSQLPSHLT